MGPKSTMANNVVAGRKTLRRKKDNRGSNDLRCVKGMQPDKYVDESAPYTISASDKLKSRK